MKFLHLTLLYCVLGFLPGNLALEYPPSSSPTKILKCTTVNPATTRNVEPGAANLMLQSKDGGLTWQDISQGLPVNEQPEDFFAGESDLHLRVKNEMYRSKGGLQTPVWKETVAGSGEEAINSNPSGRMAFNYSKGQVYQQTPAGTWSPIHAKFKTPWMPMIFETSDGTLFYNSEGGLQRSTDQGRSWHTVLKSGAARLVEENNVLIGTSQTGIIRSTDNGETWEPVISEGGVGIAIERIGNGLVAISYSTITSTRRIRISSDSGKTWQAIDEGLQSPSISSIKQMGKYLVVGHPDGIFRSADMGKTWDLVYSSRANPVNLGIGATWSNATSADNRVFEIHAFGNVLYAVARFAGC